MKFLLSKSRYVRGRQCPKSLWLYHHKPELADPISPFQDGIFRQGQEVGELAHQLFPGGVLIDEDHRQAAQALESTRKHIAGNAKVLFEAAIEFEGVLIRADIIERQSDGSWNLYEVKSTSHARKDTKAADLEPQYLQDVAVQKWVLEGGGLKINNCYLVHLNSDYVRGVDLDVQALFTRELVDEDLHEELVRVPGFVASFKEMLARDNEPLEEIGSRCNNPYVCSFKSTCWSEVGPTSIHRLARIGDSKRDALREIGVSEIHDIPDDFKLSDNQTVQARATKEDRVLIDKAKLSKFLSELGEDLLFLDFETIGYAIPRHEGTQSYKQLVFQYSLHTLRGGVLTHQEFFCEEDADPSRACAEGLIVALHGIEPIVVYNRTFEDTRLKEMALRFADLREALEALRLRLVDLGDPFAKMWYYDPRFQGKWSIKKVLPVLVPGLSYDSLDVQGGEQAQTAYLELIGVLKSSRSKEEIKRGLLEYCKLDTLAMVEIYRSLKAILETEAS